MWTVAGLALVLVLVVVALAALRWRRSRPARAAHGAGTARDARSAETARVAIEHLAQTPLDGVVPIAGPTEHERAAPLPVVLVHGLFGFDQIGVPGAQIEYFRGIAKHLAMLGCDVHAVRLPMAGSVPMRAGELVQAIDALPHERIDVIAHSLGGLDARYALAHLDLARRVRSLVTIGTPHRGTPIADLFHTRPLGWVRRLPAALGMPLDALEWLTTSSLEQFNRDVPDVPGVRYACVVGGMRQPDSVVPLSLAAAHRYLRRVAGPNDGLVPVSSQYWGETLAEIEADHFAQIGWSIRSTFDALGLYAFIVARLGDAALAGGALATT